MRNITAYNAINKKIIFIIKKIKFSNGMISSPAHSCDCRVE